MRKLKDGSGENEVGRWLGVMGDGEVMKRYREELQSEIKPG
jgi:hypothetical protein